jgi:hypothetical protein
MEISIIINNKRLDWFIKYNGGKEQNNPVRD